LYFNLRITIKICSILRNFSNGTNCARDPIKEYLKSLSIKSEIKTYESNIWLLQNQINDLTSSVAYLKSQVNWHKQSIDIHHQLVIMGFDFRGKAIMEYHFRNIRC
jgi:hypothetical protein